MATFPTLRSAVGVAKETTKFTGVVPTASIPVKKFDTESKVTKLTDAGWRGSMGDNYGMQNGTQYAEISLGGDAFVDSIGYMLAGVLGDLVTTGASAPYAHKVALLNSGDAQPKSYTLTDTQGGLQARQFSGCQFSEVNFKWDPSGLLSWESKAESKVPSTVTQPTLTWGTVAPVPAWIGALKLATIAAPNVQNAEINIKRKGITPVFALGAADPYAIVVDGLTVDGKFTFVAVDEAPFLAYLNNSGPGVVSMIFTQGANGVLNFNCTNVQYDNAKITRGKSYVEIEATWQAILNTTDVGASGGYSPVAVTVTNALPSGTFG